MCAAEGSLGGFDDGDKESWDGHYVHPTRFGQAKSRGIRTRVHTQLQERDHRVHQRFRGFLLTHCLLCKRWPPLQLPCCLGGEGPKSRTCVASPPLRDETGLMVDSGPLRRGWWTFRKRRTRNVDVLNGSMDEASISRRNDSGDGNVRARIEVRPRWWTEGVHRSRRSEAWNV